MILPPIRIFLKAVVLVQYLLNWYESFFTILFDVSVEGEENAHTEENGSSDLFHLDSSEKLKGRKLVAQQLKALYVKRFCNSKRNVKGFFCEVRIAYNVLSNSAIFKMWFLRLSDCIALHTSYRWGAVFFNSSYWRTFTCFKAFSLALWRCQSSILCEPTAQFKLDQRIHL